MPKHSSKELPDLISKLLMGNPRQRPTARKIMDHPWLHQASVESICDGTISRVPDSQIFTAMASIGIQEEVKDVLLYCNYNEILAIYKILQIQAGQNENLSYQTKPVDPGATPCPSSSDPATFPLTLKRSVSLPDVQRSASEKQFPMDSQEGGRGTGKLSTPTISHFCTQIILPVNTALQRPLTTPCTSSAHTRKGDGKKVLLPEGTEKEEGSPFSEPPPEPPAASHGRSRYGWTWHKRIWSTLRQLCCCVPCKELL